VQVDIEALCRALEDYTYGAIEYPVRLRAFYRDVRESQLRTEARRITSEFDEGRQRLDLVMRLQEAKQRQALQRKLLAKQGAQVSQRRGELLASRDTEGMVAVRFPSPTKRSLSDEAIGSKPDSRVASMPSGFAARGMALGPMFRK
jgi:hypothetical protein